MGRRNDCKVCQHDRRSDIDQMLVAGLEHGEICKMMGYAFSVPTLRRHKRSHLKDTLEPLEVPEDVPEDLLGWGLEKLVATIARMDHLMATAPAPRNAEAINGLLGRLLDYNKAIEASQGDSEDVLEIRIVPVAPPEDTSGLP